MDAHSILISADSSEGNFRDAIDIGVDVVHPVPLGCSCFSCWDYCYDTSPMGMAEAENASLRGKIRTMEAIETVTRSQERRARMKMERQLASVQELQRQG
nr:hypothetical protein [Tanacetum cinerariifolium]